ncbi:MAG: L,D-transpeptidase [Nitrospirota bacterium]|nr:L,D-transpeptidase [Nitrospirota bacterium]
MAVFWKYLSFFVRFIVALAAVAVLAPVPDDPGTNTAAFISLFSSLPGDPAIVIWKSHYSLTLYKGDIPIKTYPAVFGKGFAEGDKERIGDRRTPEGDFYICTMNHSKRFYKFMGLSYPSLKHAERGLRKGMISVREYSEIQRSAAEGKQPPWETRLGGAVGIHGRLQGDRAALAAKDNWTDGCIALANTDVDELFSIVSLGTPVTILP